MAKVFQHCIIGAGASGLMCAAYINTKSTLIIEGGAKPAAKVAISGGGKCNVTNANMQSTFFVGEDGFIDHILKGFDQNDTLSFLRRRGVHYDLREKIVKGTYFCRDSKDVINALQNSSDKCQKKLNTFVKSVTKKDIFCIQTSKGTFYAKKVIVASGGLSYPKLGAGSIGYDIAENFGHTLTPLRPALVGFTVQKPQFWFKDLSGISLEARVGTGGKSFEGSVLFTHKGISGPAILNASLYHTKGTLTIDFAPGFNLQQQRNSAKNVTTVLPLPKRFVKAFLHSLDLVDKPCRQYTSGQWQLLQQLRHYEFAPAGDFGYGRAEVTKGGITTKEIDMNMQSKKKHGLFFIGEVLDVTGALGGYNIQWCFSSAAACGRYLQKEDS